MTKTAIHDRLDRFQRALEARGIKIRRSDAIEALSQIDGYRNSHEMMAAAGEPKDALASLASHLERLSKFQQVSATRDGDSCEELYLAEKCQARERGLRIAAKAFGIADILKDSFAGENIDERLDFLEGEMDTFQVSRPILHIDIDELRDAFARKDGVEYLKNLVICLENTAVLSD